MINEVTQSPDSNVVSGEETELKKVLHEKENQMMVARTLGLPITGSVALYLQMGMSFRDALRRANDVDVYMGSGKDIPPELFHRYYFLKRQEVKASGAEVVTETYSPGLEKRAVEYREGNDYPFIHKLILINDIVNDNVQLLLTEVKNYPAFIFTSEESVTKVLNRIKRLYAAKPYLKGSEKDVYKLRQAVDNVTKAVLPVLEDKKLYEHLSDAFYASMTQELVVFKAHLQNTL